MQIPKARISCSRRPKSRRCQAGDGIWLLQVFCKLRFKCKLQIHVILTLESETLVLVLALMLFWMTEGYLSH